MTPSFPDYPKDKYRFIIDLMQKFELCFEIDRKRVLIPDILEVQEAKFDFHYDNSLKFIIEYDFLPRSVMPRFIVRMHEDIKEDLRWRTGVVLEDNFFHSTAIVKSDDEAKKIYIYVNGEQKRDYFSTIRKTFGVINNSFEKLEAKELVPLPDNNEITIEYEELVGYEIMGKDDYTIGKLRRTYRVSELLNGIESPEKRKIEYKKDNINIHIHDLVKDSGSSTVNVEQNVSVEIEMKIDLPSLQKEFKQFKREVVRLDDDLKNELKEVEEDLLAITPNSEQGKINKAVNKLSAFLQDLNDKDSKFHRIISGTQKGIEYAQNVGKTYNKFAQWLALPTVPDVFL